MKKSFFSFKCLKANKISKGKTAAIFLFLPMYTYPFPFFKFKKGKKRKKEKIYFCFKLRGYLECDVAALLHMLNFFFAVN